MHLYHIPLNGDPDTRHRAEYCHIEMTGRPGSWRKDPPILLDNCKINVFMKGQFSVFVGNEIWSPVYGDLCVLAPFEQHYGQIPAETELDYFQLDVGVDTLEAIPGGRDLFARLTDRSLNPVFARPTKEAAQRIIDLCFRIEDAVIRRDFTSAYAYMILTLSSIAEAYRNKQEYAPHPLTGLSAQIRTWIHTHYADNLPLSVLASELHVSESYLSRIFKREVGNTIHGYLNEYRVVQSVSLLKTHSVTEVCYICGYSDVSHYIRHFRRYFGCTPGDYLKRDRRIPGGS